MKTRLQRFMADCGVASRRECEALIQQGHVRVNGRTRCDMPVMIDPEKDIITVDDETLGSAARGRTAGTGATLHEQDKAYYLLNKPKGILVTNCDPSQRKTVGELMTGIKERVFPIGRLDMDARGALIMTNDGELANRLTHPRFGVEKTYIVEVDGRVSHDDVEKIKRGMWLGPENPQAGGAIKSERFRMKLLGRERGRTVMEIKSSEGKNREIRRVMARLGHVVRDLNRVAIAGKITTQGLDPGAFRPLTEQEIKWLYYAASPEFHEHKKNATQQWYEQKEMEKERKRLAGEEKQEARSKKPETKSEKQEARSKKQERPSAEAAAPTIAGRRVAETRALRPERKGRKPFIPPTGRNAGKVLGGNYIGRKRLETEQRRGARRESERTISEPPPSPAPIPSMLPTPHIAHPLGKAAKSED